MSNYSEMAKEILQKAGGKENIKNAMHCMTRLRLRINDEAKVDVEGIKKIAGVIDVKIAGGQYQVIIGQAVGKVYSEFIGLGVSAADDNAEEVHEKLTLKSIGNGIINAVIGSTIPILSAMIGGGMLKVVAMLIKQIAPSMANDPTLSLITMLGDSVFFFMPVLIGAAAAKHFKTSLPLALALTSFLINPDFIAGLADGSISHIFGLPVTAASYKSSVLPAILTVFVLSKVEKAVKKYVPEVLSTVLVPLITMFVMLPLMIVALAPLGDLIGSYMALVLMFLYDKFGFIGMGVMGALRPLLIFTGMHHALSPIALNFITTQGYDPFFFNTGMTYVIGSGAACFAVFLRAKDTAAKSNALTCSTTAFLGGITEPSLYGVLFRYKRPLAAVMIANFAAGAYMGLTKTYFYTMPGSTGLFGVPALVGPTPANFINGLIALVISAATAFVLTFIFGIKEEAPSGSEKKDAEVKNDYSDNEILAPVSGEEFSIEQVDDETFASKALGDGTAFKPEGDKALICAPANGTITAVFPTGHAFGMISNEGVEMLVHIGINTVEAKGNGFRLMGPKVGDKVKGGTPIIEANLKELKKRFDMSTMLIIVDPNGKNIGFKNGEVECGQVITV
ncbi:MAG: glucose PTS transporter subunit IIA [Lachnospiraceae bacterium]|nr:glucose PTS transporter subunit IIA [Lachnospiraceae bacterium]